MAGLHLFALLAVILVVLSSATPSITHTTRQSIDTSPSPEEEITTSPSPSPEDDDDDVCVDQRYLVSQGHSNPMHLVHRTAPLANTFCPPGSLPCATAHHMVRIANQNLSYEQLCKTVSCTRRVIRVNSVFSHLWKETSHDQATLTMFDARYPESPQKALHWSMHMSRRVVG